MTKEMDHNVARSSSHRYAVAILSVLLAILARIALNLVVGTNFPFVTYFLAVMFTVWYGGLGPALVALGLGLPAAVYFFISADTALVNLSKENLVGLVLYLVVGLGLAFLGAAMHRAANRAEQSTQAIIRSKELLSATLSSIGDAVIATDPQGRITFINSVAESLTGWQQNEAIGQPLDAVFRIFNEATRATVESPVIKVLREGVVVGLANHTVLINKDGRQLPIDDSGAPIKDPDGTIVGVILVFHDVTERQRYEAALRASEERFSKAFRASPLAMSISRFEDRRFIDVNDSFLAVTGYSREAVLGRRGVEVGIWPTHEERARVPQIDEEQGSLRNVECRLRLQSGQIHTFSLSAEVVEIGGEKCVLSVLDDISERKQAEDALKNSEHRFRALIEHSSDSIALIDENNKILYLSPSVTTVEGYAPEELLGRSGIEHTHPDDLPLVQEVVESLLANPGKPIPVRWRRQHKNGQWLWLEGFATNLLHDEAVRAIVTNYRDITERKNLEEQLVQSQKMEAVGRLAGGIAHDFNNLLTAILGYSEMVMSRLRVDDPMRAEIAEIERAGQRAATLTGQLLAFSRRQILQPRILNLNTVIADISKMLQRLIGEDIDLRINLDGRIGSVKADPGQLEQVIMNLAVNSRDAMPAGGKLTIETQDVMLDSTYASQHAEVRPGPYVLLAISDTGTGMDKATQARLFEPFFTTKEKGRGTGLGLATVYGIVKQSGGQIWVYSEPDKGATFKIYLPQAEEAAGIEDAPPLAPERFSGSETVLLVEDEDGVRSLVRRILQMNGYRVLEAGTPEAALRVAEQFADPIHLLVTDVVMPGMSGRALAEILTQTHPATRVLYISGYTENAIVHHGILDSEIPFLQKPFTPEGLLRKVREVLDG